MLYLADSLRCQFLQYSSTIACIAAEGFHGSLSDLALASAFAAAKLCLQCCLNGLYGAVVCVYNLNGCCGIDNCDALGDYIVDYSEEDGC